MRFLEDESAYRSNRMNLLFHQLQSVVIPSIIDDIRYVHSVAYEKSWTNRARYWFKIYRQIKWENGKWDSRNKYSAKGQKYQHSNQRRSYRSYVNEDDVASDANVKTDEVATRRKVIKSEKKSKSQSKGTASHKQDAIEHQTVKRDQTMSNVVEKAIASNDCNNNSVPEAPPQEIAGTVEKEDKVGLQEANEESDLSKSLVIIEANVSVVSVPDDDNHPNDLNNDANPPEGEH